MASLFTLRCEMHSIILRGVKKFRDIELVHEAAEQTMLDARMTVAGTLDDQFDDEWAPSPEEIVAACNVIQSDWSDEERERRGRFEYTSTRTKRYVADFKQQQHRPATAENIQVDAGIGYDTTAVNSKGERQRIWRERNRERVRAYRQTPEYKAKKLAESRRYRERNQFAIKEREYAVRDQRNAARLQNYHDNIEVQRANARERARRYSAAAVALV